MLKILQSSQQDKLKRLLSVMLPIIGTQIATIGMNFFDASMSGQAGAVDLAGTAIGGNIWMPVQTGINGVLMAGMPLVAHLLGAGEKYKINIVVRHGLLLAIAFAVLVIISGIIGLPLLLHGTGAGGLSRCHLVYGRYRLWCAAVFPGNAFALSSRYVGLYWPDYENLYAGTAHQCGA